MNRCFILMMSVAAILAGFLVPALGDPIGDWIGRAGVDAKARAALAASWNEARSCTPIERLDRFGQIAARLDGRIGYFAGLTPEAWSTMDLGKMDADLGGYPPGIRDNLRLWVARKLVHASLYDEADGQLDERKLNDDAVLDKMSLYFYRAVVAYCKMDKINTIKWVKKLNTCEKSEGLILPERYKVVARLIAEDIGGLKEESLDHVARRMEDIQRRLDLGRSGEKVQKKEDEVIEALEKIIKKIEEQQKKSGSGSSTQSVRPALDSVPMGGKGVGKTDPQRIGVEGAGWGNLPEKDREKAMQDVRRRFPAHYREVIEEYFRRMAEEK